MSCMCEEGREEKKPLLMSLMVPTTIVVTKIPDTERPERGAPRHGAYRLCVPALRAYLKGV